MVFVILTIDERLDDAKKCVASICRVYGLGANITLATYGGVAVGRQPLTEAYAKLMGFDYLDVPRHGFLTEDDTREWHACEVLARMQITRVMTERGYSEIYIMHADVRVLGDFRPCFQPSGKWSFAAILLRAKERFSELVKKGSWALYFEGNQARLADILVRYNQAFVAQMYAKYGDDRGLWEKWLSKFMLFGDLAQFDVARETEGFTGRAILEDTDEEPMLCGTVKHEARQAIPACLSDATRKGLDREGMVRNFERRVLQPEGKYSGR
ncbi:MAG: hypothetical protein WC436_06195 [Candidatus Babeliales bacterium]